MLEKMTIALKELNSNLGLPEEVIRSVAKLAIVGLPSDSDDEAIKSRAGESHVNELLKTMQSEMDKVRSKRRNKGANEPIDPVEDAKMDELLSLMRSQRESNDALRSRLEALEGAAKVKSFETLVSAVCTELSIPSSLLGLVKSSLSPDMDETALRNAIGAHKKSLLEAGVLFSESGRKVQTDAAKLEAEKTAAAAWVDSHKVD